MTVKDLILAIDVGTQSTKALVYTLEGRVQARQQVPYRPYFSQQPGWAEQDPEVYWQAVCQACRKLWHSGDADQNRVAGLALTAQRATVVNLDQYGRPLRPAMVWLDQRKASGLKPIQGIWGLVFRFAGLTKTVAYLQAEAEANWIQNHQPEIWNKTAKYLLLSGYLNYRLTGRYIDSIAGQVGYIPFDYRRLRWASARSWRWQVLPITPDMLPNLAAPGQILGQLIPGAAASMGLPQGLPVVAAAADKACEVIGCGALTADAACLSYGTTATVNVTHNAYLEPIRLLPAYPSALPDHYSLEVQVYRGYWMVRWFKEQFGQPETQQASALGVDAESLFEDMLDVVEPGTMGLILQPFWSPGLKFPGTEAKGAVVGFGDVHARAHLYRAILEGIAYALREGKERIERRTRVRVNKLLVTGGGSRSRNALQLTADVFGLPVARPQTDDTSALGAAINAGVGLKFHPDYSSAVKAMVRLAPCLEPDPTAHRRYDALYRDVYLKLYKRLKPLYRRIREITGYPE
jgi:sugar (pentulose or hexulose) kinase